MSFGTYPSVDTVLHLSDIIANNPHSISTLKACLEARGWCKVQYPNDVQSAFMHAYHVVNGWLTTERYEDKTKYSLRLPNSQRPNPQSDYGYHCIAGYKEGLRILTGEILQVHNQHRRYPDHVQRAVMHLSNLLDQTAETIITNTLHPIYQVNDIYNLANPPHGLHCGVSLLTSRRRLKQEPLSFAMLDFVNYFNDQSYITQLRKDNQTDDSNLQWSPDVLKSQFNVFEHCDPGLFALSFLSSNDGLQLYDPPTDQWIDVDRKQGIWWNGNLSHQLNSNLKAGKHRVLIDESNWKPRFTGWYEVSTTAQLNDQIKMEAWKLSNYGQSLSYGNSNVNGNGIGQHSVQSMASNHIAKHVPQASVNNFHVAAAPTPVQEPVQQRMYKGFNASKARSKSQPRVLNINSVRPRPIMANNSTNINSNINTFAKSRVREYTHGIPMSKSGRF